MTRVGLTFVDVRLALGTFVPMRTFAGEAVEKVNAGSVVEAGLTLTLVDLLFTLLT